MPRSLAAIRTLVLEDSERQRLMLEDMLSQWAIVPELAATAEEAVAWMDASFMEGKPVQLILADADLPDGGSVEFANLLAHSAERLVPVIWMTSGVVETSALQLAGGRNALVREVIQVYREGSEQMIQELERGLKHAEFEAVVQAPNQTARPDPSAKSTPCTRKKRRPGPSMRKVSAPAPRHRPVMRREVLETVGA